jgi:hypothetical protein
MQRLGHQIPVRQKPRDRIEAFSPLLAFLLFYKEKN